MYARKKKKNGKGQKRRKKLTETVIQQTIEKLHIQKICIATNVSQTLQITLSFFSDRIVRRREQKNNKLTNDNENELHTYTQRLITMKKRKELIAFKMHTDFDRKEKDNKQKKYILCLGISAFLFVHIMLIHIALNREKIRRFHIKKKRKRSKGVCTMISRGRQKGEKMSNVCFFVGVYDMNKMR